MPQRSRKSCPVTKCPKGGLHLACRQQRVIGGSHKRNRSNPKRIRPAKKNRGDHDVTAANEAKDNSLARGGLLADFCLPGRIVGCTDEYAYVALDVQSSVSVTPFADDC